MSSEDYISLSELQNALKGVVEDAIPDSVWVKAEVVSLQLRSNGHCYLDLAESGPSGIVAKAHAVIWRSRYALVSKAFEAAADGPLQAGMQILALVQVSYSGLYGMTLSIEDIEPMFTLGDAEKRRRETIARLEELGLMDLQKELELPLLPYRLAVISASDAAGYGDFCRHLEENEYGFAFEVRLFPAVMQGPGAPLSMMTALHQISQDAVLPDAVLIMRGGGSSLDLACFDDFSLCEAIARFPVPVFTAIGHDRDHHVADMVACSYVKTPTALADLFIDALAAEDERVGSFASRLRLAFSAKLSLMESRLDVLGARIKAADPRNVLSRGYALVVDGKGVVAKSSRVFRNGDEIRVIFEDGEVVARVENK